MSTAKKKWQAESPPARFAHNFANEIERDTWEKGQQGQKPTPATGVSAQQNAAWQAAADGDGQAPVFSLTASSRAHAPQKDNAAQQVLLAPGFQPLDMEQEIQRAQTYMQALMQGAREESQARQEQREQQQAAQQAGEAALSPSDSLKQQLEALMRQRTSTAYSGPDMRTNEEKRGGLLRTEAAALQGINTQIEQTKQAYGQAFQTELAQAENTLAQRDTDTMQQWLSTSYFMSGPQREGVENAWAEYQNTELGRIAQKDSLAAAELMTPEEYEYYTLLAALRTKANPVTAGMAGLTQPVISAIPFYENALRAWEEWAPQQLGFEPVAGTGVQETFQNAQLQHPAAYSVGRVAGEAAANSTLQGLLSNTPVGTWFNSFGQKASQTAPMQALQQLPGVGHLGTPQSITGILEGTAYDTLTQTGPYVWNQLDAYGRQQAEGLAPGEQPITPGGIALGAAQNFGQNLGYNILGEWGLGIMDGGRHGPMQEAMDAAQRRAFAKSAAGEAMTAREKQLVDDLWNSDPAKASEYWAAGEFLDTEVPGASSLDGPRLHDTIEGADGYFLDRGLMEELENSGVKYTPENVMCIVKTPDGLLQWLETGKESSGWMHIEEHATDFQRRGVDDLYSFLNEVLQTQPVRRGIRPTGPYAVYEIGGKEYTLAYGKNGYIVSFYPSN